MSVLVVVLVLLGLLALGVLGLVVKGLLWLTLIAAIVFAVGAIFGFLRFRSSGAT